MSSAMALRGPLVPLPSKAFTMPRSAPRPLPLYWRPWSGGSATGCIVGRGRDREELVQSQRVYARDDEREVRKWVEDFTFECRKVLHPSDSESGKLVIRRRLWRRRPR